MSIKYDIVDIDIVDGRDLKAISEDKAQSLVVTGLYKESIPDFLDYINENALPLKESEPVVIWSTTGKVFNGLFNLDGNVAYPDDLTIIIIPAYYIKDVDKAEYKRMVSVLRFISSSISNRVWWLDELVSRNKRIMNEESYDGC